MTTKISSWGNSLGLRIPKSIALELGIADGTEVTVETKNHALILHVVQKKLTLDDLMKGVTPENRHPEFWADAPQGKEIW